jgi:hypothetical protein
LPRNTHTELEAQVSLRRFDSDGSK